MINTWIEEHKMMMNHLKEVDEHIKYLCEVVPSAGVFSLRDIRSRQKTELEERCHARGRQGK
jgi:hypothetical protein